MMLVEDGKLKLDDPVSKYIPAFADDEGRRREAGRRRHADAGRSRSIAPITITDLLRHTSGLPYGYMAAGLVRKLYAEAGLFRRDLDNAEFVARIAKLPLAEQPGTLMGLRPFHRRARPRDRGGIGKIPASNSKRSGCSIRSA